MPGTDHAGIATQAVVERRLLSEEKLSRHTLGRAGLVERIWQWKNDYEARIIGQLKQMGCSCDWQRTRFTLDEVCARAVRETFFNLFKEGKIYRGKRLVNWDTFLQTAVSDDEVFHEPVKGHFWHFKYPVVDPKPGEPTHVTIATTRPETMLGDTAVAVHPDPAAALKQAENDLCRRLADAPAKDKPEIQAQIDEVERRQRKMLPQLEQLRDMAKDGRLLELPLTDRRIPLIADPWAKPELGSGCVKITPAHDQNDYDVWQRHLEIGAINILNPDGTLNDNVAERYRGKVVKEARDLVVADLKAAELVVDIEDRDIELAHSDRSKTPIEPYLTDQWFVKMDELAQSAMDAVQDGRVRIIPDRYAKSYLDWLSEKARLAHRPAALVGTPDSGLAYTIARDSADQESKDRLQRLHDIDEQFGIASNAAETGRLEVNAGKLEELRQNRERLYNETSSVKLRLFKHKYGDNISYHIRPTEGFGEIDLFVCVKPGNEQIERELEANEFQRDDGVLDTWFSSALWPHSTLGWPEQTPELKYYYPTSVLITSRDIITLWVARMVLAGLHNVGDVPFRDVFIHPKILDGYGEGMSKSKGNGVDPVDVMEKFGADSLRFGLAYLTTETQDVRMAVEFECPHCQKLIEQTRENRTRPRIKCKHCGDVFSTQWAEKPEDKALPRGAVVSDRFELARNFCNKLWNASRFALLNLDGFDPGKVADDELLVEDSWVLSRLSTVTQQVTDALDEYRFADAARTLYDFAWDEFCSFYVEMVKGRLQDESGRVTAQRVLAHTLDTILRPLAPHDSLPDRGRLAAVGRGGADRGIDVVESAAESIMRAPWPESDPARQDAGIEAQFARFQEVLRAVRDIRARQGVAPKTPIRFSVRCEAAVADLLRPMEPYFASMAHAEAVAFGPEVAAPPWSANVTLAGMDVYVDLAELIDVPAEMARKQQEVEKLTGFIAAKEKKLTNKNFVDRAPGRRGSKRARQSQRACKISLPRPRKCWSGWERRINAA